MAPCRSRCLEMPTGRKQQICRLYAVNIDIEHYIMSDIVLTLVESGRHCLQQFQ